MALRKMAHVCEVDLEEDVAQHGIDAAWSARERVMVCVDAQRQTQNLIRRGWRMANREHTEPPAAFVGTPRWASASPEDKRALEENPQFAEDLGAEPMRVQTSEVVTALMHVAHDKHVGSIIIGPLPPRAAARAAARLSGPAPPAPGRRRDVRVVADRDNRGR
jgi:two-component system sensor histidine kinase KdpD